MTTEEVFYMTCLQNTKISSEIQYQVNDGDYSNIL